MLRLDQALGAVEEAIAWPHPPPPWEKRLAFAEPIATPEDLRRALTLLAERLCRRLAEKDKVAIASSPGSTAWMARWRGSPWPPHCRCATPHP